MSAPYSKKQREFHLQTTLNEMYAFTQFKTEYPLSTESDIVEIAGWIVDNQKELSLRNMLNAFEFLRKPEYRETCKEKRWKPDPNWRGGLPNPK